MTFGVKGLQMVKQDYWGKPAAIYPPYIFNKALQVLWFPLNPFYSFRRTFSSVMYFIIWGLPNFSRMLDIAVMTNMGLRLNIQEELCVFGKGCIILIFLDLTHHHSLKTLSHHRSCGLIFTRTVFRWEITKLTVQKCSIHYKYDCQS